MPPASRSGSVETPQTYGGQTCRNTTRAPTIAELEDESDEATDDDEKDGPKDRRGDDDARNVGG